MTLALAAELLVVRGLARDLDEARGGLQRALDSGAAAESFARMVAALGGPSRVAAQCACALPKAPAEVAARAAGSGFVRAVDTRALGLAVVELAADAEARSDSIDPAVGLTELVGIGAVLGRGRSAGADPCPRRGDCCGGGGAIGGGL